MLWCVTKCSSVCLIPCTYHKRALLEQDVWELEGDGASLLKLLWRLDRNQLHIVGHAEACLTSVSAHTQCKQRLCGQGGVDILICSHICENCSDRFSNKLIKSAHAQGRCWQSLGTSMFYQTTKELFELCPRYRCLGPHRGFRSGFGVCLVSNMLHCIWLSFKYVCNWIATRWIDGYLLRLWARMNSWKLLGCEW